MEGDYVFYQGPKLLVNRFKMMPSEPLILQMGGIFQFSVLKYCWTLAAWEAHILNRTKGKPYKPALHLSHCGACWVEYIVDVLKWDQVLTLRSRAEKLLDTLHVGLLG